MPRRIRKKSQKRFEAFLKRELAKYRKQSDRPFTGLRVQLIRRFPGISGEEAKRIAIGFQKKYFHEVLGDSIRYAKELEKVKKQFLPPKPKRKTKERRALEEKAKKLYEQIKTEGREITTLELMNLLGINVLKVNSIFKEIREETGKPYPIASLSKMKTIGIIELERDFKLGKREIEVYSTYKIIESRFRRRPTYQEIADKLDVPKSTISNALSRLRKNTGLELPTGRIRRRIFRRYRAEETSKTIKRRWPRETFHEHHKLVWKVLDGIPREKLRDIKSKNELSKVMLLYLRMAGVKELKYKEEKLIEEFIDKNKKRLIRKGLLKS